jgi:endoglucanase
MIGNLNTTFFAGLSLLTVLQTVSSQPTADIRYNQIGFYPSMPKIAVVRNVSNTPFYVVTPSNSDTLVKGMLSAAKTWSYSNESVSIADFSSLKTPGSYEIIVPGLGYTIPFAVHQRVHLNLAIGALKGYYYQRASLELFPVYAVAWARGMGHPDMKVQIHSSAATAQRPAGTIISCPRGWYDAGDYNKYIVNSGISTYTILATYEWFPEYCNQLSTNIPESGNGVPDIINEALWNVRWMLTMQDPNDGGVYTKCTGANFDAFEMPWLDTQTRYVVKKSTAAALDFAAVMAQASRVTSKFSAALPGFSDSCLQAALKAWNWARQNPAIYYVQSALTSPSINTGEYGDGNVNDEFSWAASELFVTTQQDSFRVVASPSTSYPDIPSWAEVRALGFYTLAKYSKTIPTKTDTSFVRNRLIALADSYKSGAISSAYRVAMGSQSWHFNWGSNSVAANQGMILVIAYKLTGDSTYLQTALSNLDYLLGRNPTTFCFVTGFGTHSPQHIHHRVSGSDGIAAPVPGLLAGGPNPNQEDKNNGATYTSSLPALSYSDQEASYASNEICINWNAPLVFLSVGMEASLSPNGLPTSVPQDASAISVPQKYKLLQNYPNPFNPSTTLAFQLPTNSYVQLKIFDVLGREVASLVDQMKKAGEYRTQWNAGSLPSGIYFARMTATTDNGQQQFTHSEKMLLTK